MLNKDSTYIVLTHLHYQIAKAHLPKQGQHNCFTMKHNETEGDSIIYVYVVDSVIILFKVLCEIRIRKIFIRGLSSLGD